MIIRRAVIVLGIAATFGGAGVSAPAPATAAPVKATAVAQVAAERPFTVDCGFATCSLYLNRGLTRRMVTPSSTVAALAGACGHPVCRALIVSAGLLAIKANEAASKNQCLRIRFIPRTPPVPVGLYSSGNSHCRG